MKRLLLFVVALVFAFCTTVMAADKPAAVGTAVPTKDEQAATMKADQKKAAADKKAAAKKAAAKKAAEPAAAPAAMPAAK